MGDVWERSFQAVYARELADWQKETPEGQARIMAFEDAKGTGELFREALKYTGNEKPAGGVKRILGRMGRGGVSDQVE
jgi:hypothetical protein